MDGLISLIIFFIISSIFSNKKKDQNKNRKKLDQDDLEMNPNVENKNPQWMEEIWTEMKTGKGKTLLSAESLENFTNKAKSLKSKSIKETSKNSFENKNKSNNFIDDKNRSNNQILYTGKDAISNIEDDSGQGTSMNSDYILRETPIEDIGIIAKPSKNKTLFRNQGDFRKAIIMKEIIDRPLSIRNLK